VSLRFFMHTAKAVSAGHPDNRVFVVVHRNSRGEFVAWKMQAMREGVEFTGKSTSGIVARSSSDVEDLITRAKSDGSQPTAVFRPDSLYRELTEAQLFRRVR
jgi:hypothetical protein